MEASPRAFERVENSSQSKQTLEGTRSNVSSTRNSVHRCLSGAGTCSFNSRADTAGELPFGNVACAAATSTTSRFKTSDTAFKWQRALWRSSTRPNALCKMNGDLAWGQKILRLRPRLLIHLRTAMRRTKATLIYRRRRATHSRAAHHWLEGSLSVEKANSCWLQSISLRNERQRRMKDAGIFADAWSCLVLDLRSHGTTRGEQ